MKSDGRGERTASVRFRICSANSGRMGNAGYPGPLPFLAGVTTPILRDPFTGAKSRPVQRSYFVVKIQLVRFALPPDHRNPKG